MKRSLFILAVVASALLLAVSCGRKEGGRIIPRSKMSKIYAEFLLTDQWIATHRQYSRQADTSLVYEPILNKYGYTTEDYRASVAHYLHDSERYARMLKETKAILEKGRDDAQKRKDIEDKLNEIRREMAKREPVKVYYMSGLMNKEVFVEGGMRFYLDTNGGEWTFDPSKGADTLYDGPVLIYPEPIDSVKFRADSIAFADSLARLDSLARVDSLARADSLARIEVTHETILEPYVEIR